MKGSKDSVTTALYQEAKVKKDGTQTIYLRLTINRKIKTFPTGVSIPAKFWDKQRQQVKTSVTGLPNARAIAENLRDQKAELDKAILELIAKGHPVSHATVKHKIEGGSRATLLEYCEWRCKCEQAIRAKWTVKAYQSRMAAIRAYDPKVRLSAVTPRWLEEFTEWMLTTRKNTPNSVSTVHNYLNKILSYAAKHGDIPANPMIHFEKVTRQSVERHYLTSDELRKLLEMYHQGFFLTKNLPPRHRHGIEDAYHHTLQRLLASCFSGLRFGDIAKLSRKDFDGTHLSIVMQKVKEPLRIPINKPLRSVLNLEEGAKSILSGRTFTNGYTNDRLEVIMRLAGIDKHITFHCARHTFAIMGLEVGIPIEVVSHLLGHSNLTTTKIYARVVDLQKTREMAKMDAFMPG
jgi:integrase